MPLEGFKKKKKKKKNGEKMLFLGGKCDVMTIQIWTLLQFFRKKQEHREKMPFIAWKGYKNGQNLNM